MGVGPGGVRRLDLRHLVAQVLQLVVERRLVGEERGQPRILLGKLRRERLELRQGLRRGRRGLGYEIGIEGERIGRLGAPRVVPREEEANMEELAHRVQRIDLPHRPRRMDGEVAEILDDAGLGEDRRADRIAECGFVDEGAELVLIGQLQRAVIRVEPVDRQLQRAARIEAGCACIGIDQCLRPPRRFVELRPLGLEEGEVAHLIARPGRRGAGARRRVR